jgi:hypothetical protein
MIKRPPAPPKGKHVTVEPGTYPVFSPNVAMRLGKALRDTEVSAQAEQTLAATADGMRGCVLEHLVKVEAAVRVNDLAQIFQESHEIRGLAGNAGLSATGLIANCLCRYLDGFSQAGLVPERPVIQLHLEAMSRAAYAKDEATRLGDTVAAGMAQLVEKKLGEINAS